jgi:hypothetical protein
MPVTSQLNAIFTSAYLAILLIGYGFAGWLLAAFQVAWPVWLGTLVATLNLIRSGPSAIVLSSSWVVGLMFVAAVAKAWTGVWNRYLPYEQAQLWAQALLLIWFGAIGLVVLLAFVRPMLSRLGWRGRWATYGAIGVIWLALGMGSLIYQQLTFKLI